MGVTLTVPESLPGDAQRPVEPGRRVLPCDHGGELDDLVVVERGPHACEELVADVLDDIQRYIGAAEEQESSSSSEESEAPTLEGRKRLRNLRRRALSRARAYVAAAVHEAAGTQEAAAAVPNLSG